MLSGFPTLLQVGQTFHVAAEAWGTASEMLADVCVRRLGQMLRHTHQVGIWRTVDPLRIGKRLRQIRPPEAEELFLVNTSVLQATCLPLRLSLAVSRACKLTLVLHSAKLEDHTGHWARKGQL